MKRLTLLLILLVAATSCQPKKSERQANIIGNGIVANGGVPISQCQQGQSAMGAIFDNGQTLGASGSFQDRMVSFLSATIFPQDIGTIGSNIGESTGVRFTGIMSLDSAGNVVASRSKILISVYDSIWLERSLSNSSEQAIPVEFDPAKGSVLSGQFNLTTGQGYLLAKDNYGEVRFDGTFNTQQFSGTVSFKNVSNVTGAAAASGTLGQFMINSCGIVQK